jgi:hypothetical protein
VTTLGRAAPESTGAASRRSRCRPLTAPQGRPDRGRRCVPGRFPGRRRLGLSLERSAQVGALLATYVLETIGTQEYQIGQARFLERLTKAYGSDAADEVAPHLRCPRP